MRLPEKEYYQFLDTHHALGLYCGQSKGLLPEKMTIEQYRHTTDAHKKIDCINVFYDNPHILNRYVKENPFNYDEELLDITRDFRYFVKGDFILFKYLKDYTVFLHEGYAYGVLALNDPFSYFFGDAIPTYVSTSILPFKDKIVYDGIVMGGRIRFGSGYKRSLNEAYKKAKAEYGIITSLPFGGEKVYEKLKPEDRLSYFMKTKANREEFEDEIWELIEKYPRLLAQYYQEWGKIDARYFKKEYKELGLKKAHYALLKGKMVGVASTKKELELFVKKIVPKEKLGWVYYFSM